VVPALVAGERVASLADGGALLARVALRVRPVDGFDVVLDPGDVPAGQSAQLAHAPTVGTSAHPAPHQRRVKKIWSKNRRKTGQSFVLRNGRLHFLSY